MSSNKRPKKATPRQPSKVTGQTAAQKRLAAQRAMAAASGARAARRRKLMMTVVLPVTAIVVAAAVIITVAAVHGIGKTKSGEKGTLASAALVQTVTSVPDSVINSVGKGSVNPAPQAITGKALTANGKPRILYAGAEYCPYCAAERWGMVVALSRFGTFKNLGTTASSPSDTDPNTKTFSFHGATYTSQYISFTGKELESNQSNGSKGYKTLDTLTAADQKLVGTYDAPPYVPQSGAGGIPFIDIGGKYMISGASYDPAVLQGKSREQIAAALSDPTSKIAKAVIGTANVITAAICKSTGQTPKAVCSLPGIVAAAKALGTSSGSGGSSSPTTPASSATTATP